MTNNKHPLNIDHERGIYYGAVVRPISLYQAYFTGVYRTTAPQLKVFVKICIAAGSRTLSISISSNFGEHTLPPPVKTSVIMVNIIPVYPTNAVEI